MSKYFTASVLIIGMQLLAAGNVFANNEALARAQYMLRQAAAEKAQMQSENQRLATSNKELEKKLDALEKKYAKLAKKSERKSAAMGDRVDKLNTRLEQEIAAHKEASEKLKQMMTEKNRLFGIATDQTGVLDLCVANNKKLYDINRELLGAYENKGVWGALAQAEPFTGLKQVEIENLVDEYQYRLDDLRVYQSDYESANNM
jgi:predicted nuclease with TOPRIM domain